MTTLSGPEVLPTSGGKAKQLVIFLHGLGADGNDLISLSQEFSRTLPDAHFISPNAPFPCDMAPFGYQWFSLQDRNPEKILAGVKNAAPILNGFIDAKLEELSLGDKDLALVGFSQGTMMSLYVSLRRPESCAGVLGYSGALVGAETMAEEIKSRPPICLLHGTADMVVPYQCMTAAQEIFTKTGIDVECYTCEGLGHGIDMAGIEIGRKFLQKCFA